MYIKVKAAAGMKKEGLIQTSSDHFDIFVREKAERNLANRRVCEMIAEFFGIPARKVKIISGHHSPGKILSVDVGE